MKVKSEAANAALSVIVALVFVVDAVSAIRRYKDGEKVMLYVNKVGPYFNPQETYHYYQLPVCRPNKIEHRSLSLGTQGVVDMR